MSGPETTDDFSDPLLSHLADARLMVTALSRAGATCFDVTLTNAAGGRVQFLGATDVTTLRAKLPSLMRRAERKHLNIIVRPRPAGAGFIQLDDIDEATVRRLETLACCVTETSPNNFQAFIALAGPIPEGELEEIRHRLIAAARADKGASGAGRLAGSLNVKDKHRQTDGTYPRVRLVSVRHDQRVTVAELQAEGLLADLPPAPATPPQSSRRRRLRRAPSYEHCVSVVRRKSDGEIDRSAVDYLYAVTCLDWGFSSDETVNLLRANSPKAQERAAEYANRTVTRALREIAHRIS